MTAADLRPLVRVLTRVRAGLDDLSAQELADAALDVLPPDNDLIDIHLEELCRAGRAAQLLDRCRKNPAWAATMLSRIRDEWARPTPDGAVGDIISEIPGP